jgi:hypothetical protein
MLTARLGLYVGLWVLGSGLSMAQVRTLPDAQDPRPWVEVTELGAPGDIQVLALRGRLRQDHVYTGDVVRVAKPEHDVLFYDRRSGFAFLVRAQRGPAWTVLLFECFESAQLRPGLTWTAADLDGDGRDDLIAHDPVRAEVVRVFQRGEPCR